VTAGDTISVATKFHDFCVFIAVRSRPRDRRSSEATTNARLAAFDWVAEEAGLYLLGVTLLEAVSAGELVVERG
jgi:hypothetical protein